MTLTMPNTAIGNADRMIADARLPMPARFTFRRILKRCRITDERLLRISPRLPPVEP